MESIAKIRRRQFASKESISKIATRLIFPADKSISVENSVLKSVHTDLKIKAECVDKK